MSSRRTPAPQTPLASPATLLSAPQAPPTPQTPLASPAPLLSASQAPPAPHTLLASPATLLSTPQAPPAILPPVSQTPLAATDILLPAAQTPPATELEPESRMNVDGGEKRKIGRNKAIVLLPARKIGKQGRREDEEEEDDEESDDDVLPVVGKKRQREVIAGQNKGPVIKVTSQRKRTAGTMKLARKTTSELESEEEQVGAVGLKNALQKVHIGENLAEANRQADKLISPDQVTDCGMTSQEGKEVLGAFLSLSEEDRKRFLKFTQQEMADIFLKGFSQDEEISSPAHKRLRIPTPQSPGSSTGSSSHSMHTSD